MKERPILMNTEMVKATLEKRKTQTRRPIKKAWDGFTWAGNVHPAKESGWIAWWPGNVSPEFTKEAYDKGFECPYGQTGDRLWVRETWANVLLKPLFLKADNVVLPKGIHWRPSIHMPRWASRVTLEIVNVRVERLQEITEVDCNKEGCPWEQNSDLRHIIWFEQLWNSLYIKKSEYQWKAHPWVSVTEFVLI